jgi:hypothetical protein
MSILWFELGCYLSEVSPDSMAVPVENVCMYNNFLNEIIRCLCVWFISMDRMLGGSLTTNMAHTFSFFVGVYTLTVIVFTLLTPQI